jgi:DNA topoisomerase IA
VGGEEFHTSGTMITERGYLDVYTYDQWKGGLIPVFTEGRRYSADVFAMRCGTTTSPQKLSQNELIKLMDKARGRMGGRGGRAAVVVCCFDMFCPPLPPLPRSMS